MLATPATSSHPRATSLFPASRASGKSHMPTEPGATDSLTERTAGRAVRRPFLGATDFTRPFTHRPALKNRTRAPGKRSSGTPPIQSPSSSPSRRIRSAANPGWSMCAAKTSGRFVRRPG